MKPMDESPAILIWMLLLLPLAGAVISFFVKGLFGKISLIFLHLKNYVLLFCLLFIYVLFEVFFEFLNIFAK
ncbi:hypothetical protein LC087_11585 [Bacillus carboniphilus]|uniref:DUF1656 domain-containing protein n=1 Tax=Bacillus carboniphilus TaxID=86663 RepID=A0ABY9JQ57_9BACI|nr:hypothetical protein [Bacillus carboniphilus]WLR41530.1 hypothetical protein LC087_11585 [Bacillus carboniphilus]